MKFIHLKTFLLIVCIQGMFASFAIAQSAALGQLAAKKNEFVKQQDYKTALVWGKKMLALAAKEFGAASATYANYAHDVGQLYLANKAYDQAIQLFTQASNIYKEQLGENHLYYAVGLNSQANVYYEQKNYTKALPLYQKVLSVYKAQLGKTHQYCNLTTDRIVAIYEQQQNYTALLPVLLDQLALYETQKGKITNEYAFQLSKIAEVYKIQKQYPKSAELYERSASIFSKNGVYDNQAAVLSNLSTVYLLLKKPQKSARVAQKSLRIFKDQLKDTQSANYAVTLSGLVQAYEQQNKHQALLPLYQELLPLFEQQKNFTNYVTYAYHLGSYYQEQGQVTFAQKWYQKAISVAKAHQLKTPDLIRAMTNLAVIETTYASYAKAEQLLTEGINLHINNYGKKKRNYYTLLTTLGELYRSLAKYELAEKNFLEAQKVAAEVLGTQSIEYGNIYNSLGLLYKDVGNYTAAKQHLDSAQKFYKNKPGEEYGVVLNNQGLLYMEQGLYEKAEQLFLKSLKHQAKALGAQHYEYATVLNNLGLLYFNMGIYSKAVPRFQQALEIKYRHYGKIHPYYANSLGNLGLVHLNTGNYGEAETAFDEALLIYKKTVGKAHNFYATSLLNLATLYTTLGKYKRAVVTLQKAEKAILKSVGNEHTLYASFLSQIGTFYLTTRNYEKAGDYFYSAMLMYEKKFGKTHPNYFTALLNLHFAYKMQGKRQLVEKRFRNIIPLAEKALKNDPTIFAHILRNRAFDYQALGKYKKAEALLQKSMRVIEQSLGKNNQTYVHAQGQNAVFYAEIGELARAKKQFIRFANLFLDYMAHNYPAMSEKDKLAFQYSSVAHVEAFKDFAVKQGEQFPVLLDKLFEFHLKTKLLALNFSKKMRTTILQRKNAEDLKLYDQWIAQKEYLAKLYQLPKLVLKKRGIDLMALEEKNDRIEKQLAKKYQLFARQAFIPKHGWQKIQKALQPNEVVIEMVRTSDWAQSANISYGVWVIKGGKATPPKFLRLKNGYQLERRYLRYYRGRIKYKGTDRYSYSKFWQPIQQVIDSLPQGKEVAKIYFSPTGFYNQVNLNTLQNPANKQYLIDRYKIQLINTSKDVLSLRKQEVLGANTLAVLVGRPVYKLPIGNRSKADTVQTDKRGLDSDRSQRQLASVVFKDLPGTEKEVNQIANIMQQNQWQTQKLMGKEALEKHIKEVENPTILHIATHGFFIARRAQKKNTFSLIDNDVDYHAPMLRSGIVLTGVSNKKTLLNGQEDGILTAYEVANMRLEKTKLVVLSACETGLGDVRIGEGVYGLQRALKTAGAQNIIMSLWKVDDTATQKLMIYFYRNLTKFKNLKKAFRAAQREIKQAFPHPYYWGAFVLLGE
ncbi:CHAT domain-containing protein [uncultured Microscilla sp.]|uniref:CHAT domain-containing protein n=1 Tax=uncultured Microscilla sp. TaxID=432653 RepID=UPI00261AB4A5|nr:CHAT domain-containing protein [uncultured Microscilla sp.]